MPKVYVLQFQKANEELNYLENITDLTDGERGKVYGIIGPVGPGKNNFIRELIAYRDWINISYTADLLLYDTFPRISGEKEASFEDALKAVKKDILDERRKKKSILWLKDGDFNPGLLNSLLADKDVLGYYKIIIYSYVRDLGYGSTSSIGYLTDDEIIPMFSSVSDVPSSFGLGLEDLDPVTIKAYRSANLILSMSNYLRDIRIKDKEHLIGILKDWSDPLWSNISDSDVQFYETYKRILTNDCCRPDIPLFIDKCMDILAFLAYNSSSSPIDTILIEILVKSEKDAQDMLDELVDHNMVLRNGSEGEYSYDIPLFVKHALKVYLINHPEVDVGHTASAYRTFAAINELDPDQISKIIHDNGSSLVSFFNQLKHRIIINNRKDVLDDYVDRIHSECALKTIKGDFASCLFLEYICHHNEKNPNEDTLPFIRDIPLSQMTDSSVPDSRNRDIVEKFSDKYKLDIDLSSASTTVGDLIDSYLDGHSTPGSRKAIEDAIDKHDNKVNLSGHDILMTIRDNQAELILDAVDSYCNQSGVKERADDCTIIRHILYFAAILASKEHLINADGSPYYHSGIIGTIIPYSENSDEDDEFTYDRKYDVVHQYLRMIYELNISEVNIDFTTGPLLKSIQANLDRTDMPEYSMDNDMGYGSQWRLLVKIMVRMADHVSENDSADADMILDLLDHLTSDKDWWLQRKKDLEKDNAVFDRRKDGRDLITHCEGLLASERLKQMAESYSSPGNPISFFADKDGKTDTILKTELYDIIGEVERSASGTVTQTSGTTTTSNTYDIDFFSIKSGMSPSPSIKSGTIYLKSLLYRLMGDAQFDIDASDVKTRNYYAFSLEFYYKYRTGKDLFHEEGIDKIKDDISSHSMKLLGNIGDIKIRDDFLADLLYRLARCLYAYNERMNKTAKNKKSDTEDKTKDIALIEDPEENTKKKMDINTVFNAAWECCTREFCRTRVNLIILKAHMNLSSGKYIETQAILRQLKDRRYSNILAEIQKARIEEAWAKYLENQIKSSAKRDELRLRSEARNHYIEAEKHARKTRRTWVYMRLKSEIYRLDSDSNDPRELNMRSSELLSYLNTDEARYHVSAFNRIVKNLSGGRDTE